MLGSPERALDCRNSGYMDSNGYCPNSPADCREWKEANRVNWGIRVRGPSTPSFQASTTLVPADDVGHSLVGALAALTAVVLVVAVAVRWHRQRNTAHVYGDTVEHEVLPMSPQDSDALKEGRDEENAEAMEVDAEEAGAECDEEQALQP
eukprot:COSAG02_NODE_112_length_35994_cov_12.152695_3_plen_150_part_00